LIKIMKNMPKILLSFFIAAASFYHAGNAFSLRSEYEEIRRIEADTRSPEITVTRPKAEYNASNLKDPFRIKAAVQDAGPEIDVTVNPPDLKIQGVVWGGQQPQAIINNKVLKIGDVIEKARIINISQSGIDIFYEGRQFKISSPASAYLKEKNDTPKGGENEKKL